MRLLSSGTVQALISIVPLEKIGQVSALKIEAELPL